MTRQLTLLLISCTLGSVFSDRALANPWADIVVNYVQGAGVGNDFITGDPFNDPTTALGSPTRFTSPDAFGGAVTPFQSPFRANELVSIGQGGSLTVSFDQPVLNDPRNPYGVDLLIFGNAFYFLDFGTGQATGGAGTEGGNIEVSADGINFISVLGLEADGVFPTLGYSDVTEPFPAAAGMQPTNFTRPVDPSFDPTGLDILQIATAYDGSGGGVGIDIGAVGLDSISFVRITNPNGSGVTPEIDAFADVAPVPEPTTWIGFLICAALGIAAARFVRRKSSVIAVAA